MRFTENLCSAAPSSPPLFSLLHFSPLLSAPPDSYILFISSLLSSPLLPSPLIYVSHPPLPTPPLSPILSSLLPSSPPLLTPSLLTSSLLPSLLFSHLHSPPIIIFLPLLGSPLLSSLLSSPPMLWMKVYPRHHAGCLALRPSFCQGTFQTRERTLSSLSLSLSLIYCIY